MKRTYPYKAWAILPSGKPKEVEIVGPYSTYGFAGWDSAVSGKSYNIRALHPSREAAIESGLISVAAAQAKLENQLLNLRRKREALQAARGSV